VEAADIEFMAIATVSIELEAAIVASTIAINNLEEAASIKLVTTAGIAFVVVIAST
jgi:hypothetical protein